MLPASDPPIPFFLYCSHVSWSIFNVDTNLFNFMIAFPLILPYNKAVINYYFFWIPLSGRSSGSFSNALSNWILADRARTPRGHSVSCKSCKASSMALRSSVFSFPRRFAFLMAFMIRIVFLLHLHHNH